jgi:hypothetical protein
MHFLKQGKKLPRDFGIAADAGGVFFPGRAQLLLRFRVRAALRRGKTLQQRVPLEQKLDDAPVNVGDFFRKSASGPYGSVVHRLSGLEHFHFENALAAARQTPASEQRSVPLAQAASACAHLGKGAFLCS